MVDGHCVYWPERRTVTVEQSVKSNFRSEEVVVGDLPLKEEYIQGEHLAPMMLQLRPIQSLQT